MSHDLNDLLRDWPHEPGQLKVRKIKGSDGRQKLQLRIDLGLMQMETTGRPDGVRPHGVESLLGYHQRRLREATERGEPFALSEAEVAELQQEGIQYYHRYIAFFQLNDYADVIRDTQRNLEMFTFVAEHTEREELAEAVVQFTPYVLMMHTRARASVEIERSDFTAAIREVESGMEKIRNFYEEEASPEAAENSPELSFLSEWLDEIRSKKPISKLERLQREMDQAIASEAYERAAELRDAIQAQGRRGKGREA